MKSLKQLLSKVKSGKMDKKTAKDLDNLVTRGDGFVVITKSNKNGYNRFHANQVDDRGLDVVPHMRDFKSKKGVYKPEHAMTDINWKEEMKEGKFDPKNPTVVVSGLGSYSLTGLKDSVASQLSDLSKKLKGGSEMDVDNVYGMLVKNDTLLYKVKAIKDVQDELKTSIWKRRITIYKRK